MSESRRRRKCKEKSSRSESQPPATSGGRRGNAAANRLYSMATKQREQRVKETVAATNKPIISEKKQLRDKRIEEAYFKALRPDIPGKPAFRFDMKEDKKSYNTAGGGKGEYKSEQAAIAKDEKRRARLEQEWLDGLRPPIHGKSWNLDTELDRPESPERLFHSDDEY